MLMFIRIPSMSGISVVLVLKNKPELLAKLRCELENGGGRRKSEAGDWLDQLFTGSRHQYGQERVWKRLFAHDSNSVVEVAKVYPNSPYAANALLKAMEEQWASKPEATKQYNVTMTDKAVIDQSEVLSASAEALMAFIGARYRVSPKQAALALKHSQNRIIRVYKSALKKN